MVEMIIYRAADQIRAAFGDQDKYPCFESLREPVEQVLYGMAAPVGGAIADFGREFKRRYRQVDEDQITAYSHALQSLAYRSNANFRYLCAALVFATVLEDGFIAEEIYKILKIEPEDPGRVAYENKPSFARY